MKLYICNDSFCSEAEAIEYLMLFCFCDCEYESVESVSYDKYIRSHEGVDLYYSYAADRYIFAS